LQTASSKFQFGSKSATLARISAHIKIGHVCDQLEINIAEWQNDAREVCSKIAHCFSPQLLAIRSSAVGEDSWESSNAGAFDSLINVEPEPQTVNNAITKVFNSYGNTDPDQAVLVQPMVQDISVSGVLTTRVLDNGSPYFVVNYDDTTGRSDTVTSGIESKAIVVRRGKEHTLRSNRFTKLISVAQELEEITACDALDIEFCITANDEVYVLQVRPIVASRSWPNFDSERLNRHIEKAKTDIAELIQPADGVSGSNNAFGNMPDWNPAEILGPLPRPLALSLYRNLITDNVWSAARENMGYRSMANRPLLHEFCGRPYIDVRLSLNSFLPPDLEEGLAARLVDYQLNALNERREEHDKIEFKIALTSLDFAHERRASELSAKGFSRSEVDSLVDGLRKITNNALAAHPEEIFSLLDEVRSEGSIVKKLSGENSQEYIRRILVTCRRHGTLPFAILARHGFIGIAFLRTLVEQEIISAEEMLDFQYGVETVASDFVKDSASLRNGDLSVQGFLDRYGHLRPGTYDILSQRYDENPENYLAGQSSTQLRPRKPFAPSERQNGAIDALMGKAGLEGNSLHLFSYIEAAIRAREEAKFWFTRLLSQALTEISHWGQGNQISDELLSFLDITSIVEEGNDADQLLQYAKQAQADFSYHRLAVLPHLIFEQDDVDVVRLPLGQPTFITTEQIYGPVKLIEPHSVPAIDGFVVFIEQADPGFDWIFSHQLVGLVTKYGGVNSHMAIRCAEFGLPAAIGCGERLFNKLCQSATVEINCMTQSIRVGSH
jgi:glutamine kinase